MLQLLRQLPHRFHRDPGAVQRGAVGQRVGHTEARTEFVAHEQVHVPVAGAVAREVEDADAVGDARGAIALDRFTDGEYGLRLETGSGRG